MGYIVDIVEGMGGPSATAIFDLDKIPSDFSKQKELFNKALLVLKSEGFNISKIAAITFEDLSPVSFYFVQVKTKEGAKLEFEVGGNCGNSMVASGTLLIKKELIKGRSLKIKNIKTDLVFDLIVKGERKDGVTFDVGIDSIKGKKVSDFCKYGEPLTINDEGKIYEVKAIDAVNPYLIVDGSDFAIKDGAELLKLTDKDLSILDKLILVRKKAIHKLGLFEKSEFPKIAIALIEGNTVYARTIYLNNFHPDLPLTGVITLAVNAKINGKVFIKSPKTTEEVDSEINSQGEIVKFNLLKRRGVIKKLNIEV